MPNFGSFTIPPAIYQGDSYLAWNNETPGAGATSQEVALAIVPQGAVANSVSVEVVFGGAPGAFEIDLLTADTDNVNDFINVAGKITAVNANNVGRLEQLPVVANFCCLNIKTLTNNVSVTAKITSR